MGLAPYGEPKFVELILDELDRPRRGRLVPPQHEVLRLRARADDDQRRVRRLFGGPPRKPESQLTQREMDLARSIQEVTEDAMLRMARHVHRETGEKTLCMAGGVALNCVGNGASCARDRSRTIWIQPAAGDAGGALGAALVVWHQYLRQPPTPRAAGQRLSVGCDEGLVSRARVHVRTRSSATSRASARRFAAWTTPQSCREAARRLAEEKVVGWFQGRMEFGPRALGARSIIGDPRSPKMQSVMNLKIKFRECFRPFAPSCCASASPTTSRWTATRRTCCSSRRSGEDIRHEMTDAQQQLFGIEKLNVPRSTIPAVTHVDYSARVQTVTEGRQPAYLRAADRRSTRDRLPGAS